MNRSAPAAGAPAPEGGSQQPPNLTSNRRLQQTQAQVDEVSLPSSRVVTLQCRYLWFQQHSLVLTGIYNFLRIDKYFIDSGYLHNGENG